MAATFRAVATGVTFAATKSMLAVMNGAGSGRVLRVYRAWMLNNQTAGVTGVITTMEFRRISALAGGTAVTPVKHDTSSTNLVAQVTSANGGTATNTADQPLMRWMWSNDEPAASSLTSDETETIPELAKVWDCTGDANIEPLTLREGQGCQIYHPGSTAVGIADFIIEFTDAAT